MADDCVILLSEDSSSNNEEEDQTSVEYDEDEESDDDYSTTSKDLDEFLGITRDLEEDVVAPVLQLGHELELEEIEEPPLAQDEGRRTSKRKLSERDDGSVEEISKPAKISALPLSGDSVEGYKRLHELERERRNLTERLSETKEELLYSEKNLTETKKILKTSKESFHKTTEELRTQLLETQLNNSELLAEKEYYQTQSSITETIDSNTQQIIDDYTRQLRDLQCQIKDQQTKDIELLRTQRTITVLTRKLNALEEDKKITSLLKGQLNNYESVICKNELLEQQNKALKQRVGNMELLRYQLQTERDKAAALEEKVAALNQVTLNSEMQSSDNNSHSNSSVVVLQYKLLDVQQKEILLTRNVGELETKLNIAKQEIKSLKARNGSLEKQLTAEKEENRIKADAIHRLERRLLFITKEREGCVNVLNSYKLDGGAESVLREQLKELQLTLKRYEDKVTDLEQKNEELSKTINKTKKQFVLSNHEVITANERIELLQEQCQELQLEKQKYEDLLTKSTTNS